jgi:integrase
MSYAVDSGKIDISPCANWRKGRGLPKLIKAEIKPLTADEARRLVDLARTGIRRGKRARQPWLWAPAVIALAIGARRSEIAALDWPRINLETGEVAIFESLRQFSAKDVRRGGTKTGEARNPVLPAWAIAELIEWRKVQREQLLKAGIRTDAVCTYPEGNAVLPDAMTLGFRALAKAIGRPDVTFHGQRHTAASWVLDSGASIKAAQVMLGHGSAVTTLAIYGHAMPGNEKATADKLQEAFSR